MPNQTTRAAVRQWRRGLFTDLEWEKDPDRAVNPGEAGGYRVVAAGAPFAGYLKPLKRKADRTTRAANEKVVTDIGLDLGLSVPAVQLFRRNPCPDTEEPCACVVAILYEENEEWGKFFGIWDKPDGSLVQPKVAAASGIIALDTWVGNVDRNNSRNAVFGATPAEDPESELVFLDFSYTLNHTGRWDGGRWAPVEVPPMPDMLRNCADRDMVSKALEAIEGYTDSAIEEIVTRIPAEYLKEPDRDTIIAGLKGRRGLVRPALAPIFGL